MRALSTGDTFRLLRGTRTVSTGVVVVALAVESVRIVESDIAVLSVCMLCVGVGATAPVPYCDESVFAAVESLVVMVVDAAGGVAVSAGAGAGAAAGAGAGAVYTSPPVDCCVVVECVPSFDTLMCVLDWPSTTAGERAIAAIAMSLIFMCSP